MMPTQTWSPPRRTSSTRNALAMSVATIVTITYTALMIVGVIRVEKLKSSRDDSKKPTLAPWRCTARGGYV